MPLRRCPKRLDAACSSLLPLLLDADPQPASTLTTLLSSLLHLFPLRASSTSLWRIHSSSPVLTTSSRQCQRRHLSPIFSRAPCPRAHQSRWTLHAGTTPIIRHPHTALMPALLLLLLLPYLLRQLSIPPPSNLPLTRSTRETLSCPLEISPRRRLALLSGTQMHKLVSPSRIFDAFVSSRG